MGVNNVFLPYLLTSSTCWWHWCPILRDFVIREKLTTGLEVFSNVHPFLYFEKTSMELNTKINQ